MAEKGYLNNYRELERRKRRRESLIIFITAVLIVVITYIETLISAISTKLPLSNNILVFGLININIALVILLIFLVLRNFIKLFFDRRSGVLGSKLRTKLVAAFVSLTLVPTFLLFFIAMGFVIRSIEGWFGIDIENSLTESLEIAQTYYKDISEKALYFSREMAFKIADKGDLDNNRFDGIKDYIEEQLSENDPGSIDIFDRNGTRVLNVRSHNMDSNFIPLIKNELIRKGLLGEEFTSVQTTSRGDVVRAIAPISTRLESRKILGVVVVTQYIPTSLAKKMQSISNAVEEYRQLKVLKDPVKASYFIILLIITLVIVFLSTWIGFHIAKGITIPIQRLAEGTHAVAMGNLDYRIEGEEAHDEIGTLVRSFNRMTEDLKVNKINLEKTYMDLKKTNVELDQRRKYMEIVLKNVAAGVISIDKSGRITTINRSAEEMLGINTKMVLGRYYKEIMKSEHLSVLREMIRDMNSLSLESIERQLKLKVKNSTLTVLVNLTILKDENNYMGMVAVFDDLTNLLKAQRMIAWKEVARRIAHEIKNPLTPIKLSAQRLRKRYGSYFAGDGKIFDECTQTIIKQVDELKSLVDEFSHFARMPAANPEPNDLNDIVREAVALYKGAHREIRFECSIGEGIPTIEIDRDQIKRAIINLLENSVESITDEGVIKIETSFDPLMGIVRLEVSDTGCGISPEDRARLFEPYFSTKKSGTGLGLAIVNNIIADHHGYIRVKDNVPVGTKFVVELPVKV